MKKIGSVLLMFGLVCFLGGIVGCPAAPKTPKTTDAAAKDATAKDAAAKDAKDAKDAAAKDAAAKDAKDAKDAKK